MNSFFFPVCCCRFINHACFSASLYLAIVRRSGCMLPAVGLFAARDIQVCIWGRLHACLRMCVLTPAWSISVFSPALMYRVTSSVRILSHELMVPECLPLSQECLSHVIIKNQRRSYSEFVR